MSGTFRVMRVVQYSSSEFPSSSPFVGQTTYLARCESEEQRCACCLVGSQMTESQRFLVHGNSLPRHSSEVVGNTRRCPECCCCCVVLDRHSKLLGCYWLPVLGLIIILSVFLQILSRSILIIISGVVVG